MNKNLLIKCSKKPIFSKWSMFQPSAIVLPSVLHYCHLHCCMCTFAVLLDEKQCQRFSPISDHCCLRLYFFQVSSLYPSTFYSNIQHFHLSAGQPIRQRLVGFFFSQGFLWNQPPVAWIRLVEK